MRAMTKRRVLVFLKNQEDGSSYYRLYQYLRDKPCRLVNMTPTWVYRLYYGRQYGPAGKLLLKLLMGALSFGTTLSAIALDMLFEKSEVVILNRRFFPRVCPPFLARALQSYLRRKTLYWDFDDNIAADGELSQAEKRILEQCASCITATSDYLKDSLSAEAAAKTEILPTTDAAFWNLNVEQLLAEKQMDSALIQLLWLGTRDNLVYLKALIPALDAAAGKLQQEKRLRLLLEVVSNAPLRVETAHLYVKNIKWSRAEGEAALRRAVIGLMPLKETAYTLGKGGFKAIQYMSAGIVPILSPVGYNRHVIEDGISGFFAADSEDFAAKVSALAENPAALPKMARAARARYESHFSPERIQNFWSQVIGERE